MPRVLSVRAALLFVLAAPLGAQNTWNPQEILRTERYVRPPERIAEILTTPRVDISFTNQSPDQRWFLRATGVDRSDISLSAAPHVWLAGLAIDTRANRARDLTTSTRRGLALVDPKTGAVRALETPAGASISAPVWSPSSAQIAYIANFPAASYAYIVDVATGKSTRLSERPLLATLVTDLSFTRDGRQVIAVVVPEPRPPEPTHGVNGVEDGPQVRLTESRAVPQPVHNTLLQDPHDKARLAWYATGQLALIDVRTRKLQTIGAPAMINNVDASHDGEYLRVTRMVEPFSYLVPLASFGSVQELWTRAGTVVTKLATTPLRESGRGFGGGGGGGAGDTAKRNVQWNPVGPGMIYLQNVVVTPAQGSQPAVVNTRVVRWNPPFGANDTTVLFQGGRQLANVTFSTDSSTMFYSDSGAARAVRLADPSQRYTLGRNVTLGGGGGGGGRGGPAVPDSTQGQLLMREINGISYVVLGTDGKSVGLSGTRAPGANWYRMAPRPWVDRMDITTGSRTRVLDNDGRTYEELIAPLDNDLSQLVVTRESPTTIPDVWLRVSGAEPRKLTNNVDAAPEVSGAILKRFQVARPRDGTKFWVDVTLPRDWKPGQRLPGLIWFYPREYTSASDYERSRFSTNIGKFPIFASARPSVSTKLFAAAGYAYVEPDIPIYGDSGRMNDNYTRDLKEGLDAVIDALVDSGFVDRDRMGIGGHSYGAFSTVNAMTLMPNFKAGIAGDGMYNRTLTPFGFQSERRNLYQAQETYLDMSPFLRADRISGALLMYHSFEDQNTGTSIISSQRMFAALQGLGKPAAMYLYPYEDHWFYTYQSDLDLWARWLAWLDIYVKDAKPGVKPVVP
jgi:dipeptidyl aminopeptidase/acylaminoacyl peptidase